jgi:hypothetical protein
VPESGRLLDAAIARLADGDPELNARTFQQVVEYWHGPLSEADGYAEADLAGLPIPVPLRRYYLAAGRKGICIQNELHDPDDLEPDPATGRILFYTENQGCFYWTTLPEGDDPPVWGDTRDFGSVEQPEEPTLSQFLAHIAIFEGIIASGHIGYAATAAWLDPPTVTHIISHLLPVPGGGWRWPSYPARLYARAGAFVEVCPNKGPNGEGYSLFAGSMSREPLAFLQPLVNDRDWEFVSI